MIASMPQLPPEFQFSQASLQDYVECKRRFQLRYIYQLAWPAVEAEPVEQYEAHAAAGEAFHRLVHQHQLGLPVERLTALAAGIDEEAAESGDGERRLSAWWQNYLAAGPVDLPPLRYPEITLSAPAGDYRLVAKYDLVAVQPGQHAVIVDWKTGQHRPKTAWLNARLQTRVYRYVLVEAGSHLNAGAPLRPAQVAMLYWFANHPNQPERLPYTEEQQRADTRYLVNLVNEIAAAGAAGASADDFPKTDDVRRCRFCPYRSLCDRGAEAGDMTEQAPEDEDEPEAERDPLAGIDFEQIGEIAF